MTKMYEYERNKKFSKAYEKLIKLVLINFKLMAIALVAYTIWRDDLSRFLSLSFLCCFGIDLIELQFIYYKLTERRREKERIEANALKAKKK